MLPRFPKFSIPELNQLVSALTPFFTGITKENFGGQEISGTTASTANTSAKFRHGLRSVPTLVKVLEGNAYVAYNGIGADDIDIRSTEVSQRFRILVIP